MTKEKFIGTWKLVSFTAHYTTGQVTPLWGESPVGMLMYDPGGNMSVQLMRTDRPRFASENLYEGTATEKETAYDGLLTYFGTYQIDTETGTVTHHVENSSFPNWVGTDLVRHFEVTANQLTLSPPPVTTDKGTRRPVLVWERLA